MRTIGGVLAVMTLSVLAGCGAVEAPKERGSDLASLLPEAAGLEGWIVAEGPVEHTPETLYEYINGGADRYIANGFRELLHVRYQLGDDAMASVTFDIYDMGSDLGAFGIYSAARAPGVETRPWGVEGYRVETIAAAWKDSIYLHGEADDGRSELITMLESLMAGVCESIPGEALRPQILAALPVEGRVAGSERYVPADLLGHSFLPGGVLAAYQIGELKAEFYLSDLGTNAAAGDAFERLRAHLAEWGAIEAEVENLADEAFRYVDPTLGSGTVMRAGHRIVGIHGELEAAAREGILVSVHSESR